MVSRIGGVVVIGLFISIHNPFTIVSHASADSVSEFILVSVLLVVAVNQLSVKIWSSETPSICCADAVHLAFNTFVLVAVWTLTLRVDEFGFRFLLGKDDHDD